MKRAAQILQFVALFLLVTSLAQAQEADETAPLSWAGFQTSGSTSVGYRFTDVKGYQPQYQEMIGLGKGFRVLDLNFYGDAKENKNPFADHFSIQSSGLGGDPFSTTQVAVSKDKVYDFRSEWRQSYYYWNQNDNVVLPIAAIATGISTGSTSNHNWATVRKIGSADLTLHATNNLRFTLHYDRLSDDGTTFTTRSLDFYSSPSFWGSFARANPYYLNAPISDNTNRFTGGIDYTLKSWTFHYNIGYQSYIENMNLANVSAGELSINPITSSTTEPLTNLSSNQFRRLTTPVSEFTFVGKPIKNLEWRGEYIYYRFAGPLTFTEAYNGTAPGSSGPLAPYNVSQSAQASVTEPNHIIGQGLAYHVFPWWTLDLKYRYSRFTSDTTGTYRSLLNGTTSASGTTKNIWRDGLSELDFAMDFRPIRSLVIRPGVQFLRQDVESFTNGVINAPLTLRTNTAMPQISFGYEPSKVFSVRGDFHTTNSSAAYTAITPHVEQATHFVVRAHPMAKLSIEDEIHISNNKLVDVGYQSHLRSNAFTVSYALDERFSIFTGFSYDSFLSLGNVLFLRGTAPLAGITRDQEINRVWSAGFEVKPMKRFGLRFSGNHDQSSGVGQDTAEPPAYGPLVWPVITGTVYYNFPKVGQFGIDLQRTYYVEQIVTVNNFSANLLTIRWTKSF